MKNKQNSGKWDKETIVDTAGVVSYSLIVGAGMDYSAGLRGVGIVASRAYGTAINIPTGAPYGKWRDFLYKTFKTTDKSSKTKKYFTELAAFNSFQVPLYATVVGVGSLASNLIETGQFKIDVDKVMRGTERLIEISPIIGPTLGLWVELVRRMFGLQSAPKKAGESLEEKTSQ